MNKITGRAFVVGDNVNTDDIIEAQYLKLNFKIPGDRTELGRHALERYQSRGGYHLVEEGKDISDYRIIIAGENFGCGSSREQAPFALAAAGVQLVVARSFAPIYRGNCFMGDSIKARTCKRDLTLKTLTGNELEIYLDSATLENLATDEKYQIELPPEELRLLEKEGLAGYARRMNWV